MTYPSPNGARPGKRSGCKPKIFMLPLIILFLLGKAGLQKAGIIK